MPPCRFVLAAEACMLYIPYIGPSKNYEPHPITFGLSLSFPTSFLSSPAPVPGRKWLKVSVRKRERERERDRKR